MGLRFHKSVSLAKGIRVNLSKSGPSLSLGPKGATLNISKRGVYASAGLPGTGLSYRTKLGGSKSSSKSSGTSKARSVGSGSARSVAAERPCLSPDLEEQQRIWAEMQEESEEKSREFIDIYKLAPQVLTADELSQHLSRPPSPPASREGLPSRPPFRRMTRSWRTSWRSGSPTSRFPPP